MESLLRGNPRPIAEDAPRWRKYLHALWWGYRPAGGEGGSIEEEDAAEEKPPVLDSEVWTVPRVVAVQTIFGEGMTGPGNEQTFVGLVRACSLNAQKSAIEIGAGLGQLSRWGNEDTGTYFKAYEPDEELAKAGSEISVRRGMARKAPVERVAFEDIQQRSKSQDAVIAKEAFHRVSDQPALYAKISDMLKENGLLSFTAYLMAGGPQDEEVRAAFPGTRIPEVEICRKELTKAGFDVRVFEDRTDEHVKIALDAFAGFAAKVQAGSATDPMRDAVVREGEIWAPRIALMRRGRIRLYRVLAIKGEEARPPVR